MAHNGELVNVKSLKQKVWLREFSNIGFVKKVKSTELWTNSQFENEIPQCIFSHFKSLQRFSKSCL